MNGRGGGKDEGVKEVSERSNVLARLRIGAVEARLGSIQSDLDLSEWVAD